MNFERTLAAACWALIAWLGVVATASAENARIAIISNQERDDFLDHTILRHTTEAGKSDHYLLFTSRRFESRAFGKTTGYTFITQIYRLDESNETLSLVRDDREARIILSQGKVVSNLPQATSKSTDHVPTEMRECDFLSARFWPFEQGRRKQPSWYFFKLSTRAFSTSWSGSLPCTNYGGNLTVSSNISARLPAIYRIGATTLLVDYDDPVAFFIRSNGKRCLNISTELPRNQQEKVIYLFGNEPPPESFRTDLGTENKVRLFLYRFHIDFSQTLNKLSRGCEEIKMDMLPKAEFLDNTRPYVQSNE